MSKHSTNTTDKFIDLIYEMQLDISENAVLQSKKCLLDYFSASISGAPFIKEKIKESTSFLSNDKTVKIIGTNDSTNLLDAAFINGMSSHINELDDGHRFGAIHLGGPIFSAMLSYAQVCKISDYDFSKGVIIGYEVGVRLSKQLQPKHKKLGFHSSGTVGTIAATLALCSGFNLEKEKWKHALSASSNAISGMLNVGDDVSELKPFNIGKAATNALLSFQIAKNDFKGPDDILGGFRGLFAVYGDYNKEIEILNRENLFAIEEVYFKLYAACRHAHPAIDATLTVLKELKDIKKIKKIDVFTYQQAIIGHDHKKVKNASSAKMSIPYCVSLAILKGKVDLECFEIEYINSEEVKRMMQIVDIVEAESMTKNVPHKRSAQVDIYYEDLKISHFIENPKGEPEYPFTIEDLKQKFKNLTNNFFKSNELQDEFINHIFDSETSLYKIIDLI